MLLETLENPKNQTSKCIYLYGIGIYVDRVVYVSECLFNVCVCLCMLIPVGFGLDACDNPGFEVVSYICIFYCCKDFLGRAVGIIFR